MNSSAIIFIGATISYDSIGNPVRTETKRRCLATIHSVSRAEWEAAGRNGIKTSAKVVTAACNYKGEELVELDGARYSVYRTYQMGDEIELYLEERGGNDYPSNTSGTSESNNGNS